MQNRYINIMSINKISKETKQEIKAFIFIAIGGILGTGLSIMLKNGGCIDGSEIFANMLLDKIYQRTGKKLYHRNN